jgi:hypothetical protein
MQGLVLARQVLYHLSHSFCPILCFILRNNLAIVKCTDLKYNLMSFGKCIHPYSNPQPLSRCRRWQWSGGGGGWRYTLTIQYSGGLPVRGQAGLHRETLSQKLEDISSIDEGSLMPIPSQSLPHRHPLFYFYHHRLLVLVPCK